MDRIWGDNIEEEGELSQEEILMNTLPLKEEMKMIISWDKEAHLEILTEELKEIIPEVNQEDHYTGLLEVLEEKSEEDLEDQEV
jgi:hypothetical protein